MTVHVDEMSTTVEELSEQSSSSGHSAAGGEHGDSARARLEAERHRRVKERTRAEGYDD